MDSTTVLAPVTGTAVAMAEIDDPVFAAGIVGPGLGIDPDPVAGRTAVAPIAGEVTALHAHAFVIQGTNGKGVLVHLGINTVQLGGEGFTLHAQKGDQVAQGQQLISWDPAAVVAGGRSAVCPVVALDATSEAVTVLAEPGSRIEAGSALLTWA